MESETTTGSRVLAVKDTVAFVTSDEGERVAALDLDRPADPPLILQGSAAVIWGLIDGSRTVDEVVTAVAQHFGEDEATVRGAVDSFLTDLEQRHVVRQASP